jgi:hypothetical protein
MRSLQLEYSMSLPASEQRALDGIAGALRAGEPRLASMFAMFTNLNKNERRPLREQLSAARLRRARLTRPFRYRFRRRHLRRAQVRQTRRRLRLLIVSQIAVAAAVIGMLVGFRMVGRPVHAKCAGVVRAAAGLTTHRAATCQQRRGHLNGLLIK